MTILNFDASQVAPSEAREAIPAGWYTAKMIKSEMKATSDGTGQYLACEFEVIGGDYNGYKLFDRLNLQNKNQTATEIGWRTLSAICHAVNVIQVADSQQLHGIPLQVKVKLRPAGPGADGKYYEASNEISGYKAAEVATAAAPAWATTGAPAPAAPAPATSASAPAAPAPTGMPPWATAPAPTAAAPAPAATAAAPAPQPPQAPAAVPPWMK